MIFRGFLALFLISILSSCDFIGKATGFSFNETSVDTIIDFNKVDELPVFPNCKSLIDTDKKNRCFINNLYNHFSEALLKDTYGVPECTNETVVVRLKIDSKGKASLKTIESSKLVKLAIPNLERLVLETIDSLPRLFPAIKRGIPVSAEFELPIVIKLK